MYEQVFLYARDVYTTMGGYFSYIGVLTYYGVDTRLLRGGNRGVGLLVLSYFVEDRGRSTPFVGLDRIVIYFSFHLQGRDTLARYNGFFVHLVHYGLRKTMVRQVSGHYNNGRL